MSRYNEQRYRRINVNTRCQLFDEKNKNKVSGLINSLINKIPVELHVPGYQYCGPGTNLKKRIARGDPGTNTLDSYCKDHDIAYDRSNALSDRRKADYILENKAWHRVKARDSSLREKAVAWGVTTAMKLKRKLGSGCMFKSAVKAAKNILKKNKGEKDLLKLARKCLVAAKKTTNTKGKKSPRRQELYLSQKREICYLLYLFLQDYRH
ncbi:uncharacterized protein LOC112679776 isoform X2 [Sipha flava]|uniref:Uncharacterized protein LOC112679776 isoform X2 n=1 Tax=Sipha flava TaxID=143950 RepID=A0A8B8F578_9HEMI|nr:uncharacterized protein LOC112679776 isoform X2 [Sipha flava]